MNKEELNKAAYEYGKEFIGSHESYEVKAEQEDVTNAFIDGAEFQDPVARREQRLRDYWDARKSFCFVTCGPTCPMQGNDFEMTAVKCDKLDKFVTCLANEYKKHE